jgi:rhamnogalacturonan endolyase
MVLRDPYVGLTQVSNLWVGLTAPDYFAPSLRRGPVDRRGFGSMVDWQRDSKHYQFWVKADPDGRFVIPKVRPGEHWLHAFADGVLGEFTRTNIAVASNQSIALGDLEWTPVHYGRPLWEIGIPDRTALEFRNGTNAWQWGTYLKYQKEFPTDVNFIIGQSDWRRDWNYVQPPRLRGGKLATVSEADEEAIPASSLWRTDVANTTWSIQFKLPEPVAGKATLRLAFCGTHNGCRVEVLVNGRSVGDTGQLPSTSAMQRDSARAYWTERPVSFDAALLKSGNNTIQLVSHATSWSQGVMYDYVRLELSENDHADPSP